MFEGMEFSKKELRKRMKLKRLQMTAEEVKAEGDGIFMQLVKSGLITEKTLVLSFASYKNEPDTSIIHTRIKQMNVNALIAYPRVNDDRKSMNFYIVEDTNELVPGYMGIAEPDTDETKRIEFDAEAGVTCGLRLTGDCIVTRGMCDKVVMLMPGLAYDNEGSRIGYGGGFYDRYLNDWDINRQNIQNADAGGVDIIKIGIGYDFQILKPGLIESEPHDIKLDYVVTGKNIYKT